MTNERFEGTVYYFTLLAIPQAKVTLSVNRNWRNKILWQGDTDDKGIFQGNMDVNFGEIVQFKVEKHGQSHSGPFIRIPGSDSFLPIVTPWIPSKYVYMKGRVFYINSVLPVPEARVKIIAKNQNLDDVILWDGETDNFGNFHGRILDVGLLFFKVEKHGQSHSDPFIRIPGSDSFLPIVTPWAPMDVFVKGIVKSPVTGSIADVSVTLYTIDIGRQGGIRIILNSKTDSNGVFSNIIGFSGDLPFATLTSLAFWFELRKGSDSWAGIFSPFISDTIYVPWGLNPLAWRIIDHGPDVVRGRTVLSNVRKQVGIFNFASIRTDNYKRFNYKDSGQRFSFRLDNEGVLKYREASPGFNFNEDWKDFLPFNQHNPMTISYLKKRAGEKIERPKFDLIAAGGNRILAKEKGTDRLFFAIIDELFWQYKDPNNPMDYNDISVPGVYFKLDPETGIPGANNQDSVRQIEGDFNNHPETWRWPLYRKLIGSGISGMMIVSKKPRVWHQMDSRPPHDSKAKIPSKFPSYSHITYENALFPDLLPHDKEHSINFKSVLDLGVGSVHRHENYSEIYGGEMQPILTEIFGFGYYLHLYQFFNGQVQDGDGFVDGTCNYYMLVKLDDANPSHQKYALLFIDEQMIFSKRWRAVDLSDYFPDSPIPPNFMFVTELKSKEFLYRDQYGFDMNKFWCPFTSGYINGNSRLAVARQVIAINGGHAGEQQIFTINFSWGTCDRTWRWRNLPEKTKAIIVPTRKELSGMHGDPEDINSIGNRIFHTQLGDVYKLGTDEVSVTSENKDMDLVFPETIKIRDDMTLILKGIKRFLTQDNKIEHYIGRYYQKYLPADLRMPEPKKGMPDPFGHVWQFVTESVYKSMEFFSHFGVYETVDSRCQYYLLEDLSASDVKQLEQGAVWEDVNKILYIKCPRIDWVDVERRATAGNFGTLFNIDSFPITMGDVRPLSMFNDATYFHVTHKEGLGYIATFWDKRDDDLKPVENKNTFPLTVELKKRNSNIKINIRFSEYQEMSVPPLVEEAKLILKIDRSGDISSASVLFVLPEYIYLKKGRRKPDVKKCIWRVVVDALPGSKEIVKVFDRKREGEFRKTDEDTYICDFIPTAKEADMLKKYYSPETYWKSGASIWFEDVVGQKNIAQVTKFEAHYLI